jgi:hypothetical protein
MRNKYVTIWQLASGAVLGRRDGDLEEAAVARAATRAGTTVDRFRTQPVDSAMSRLATLSRQAYIMRCRDLQTPD